MHLVFKESFLIPKRFERFKRLISNYSNGAFDFPTFFNKWIKYKISYGKGYMALRNKIGLEIFVLPN